MNRILFLAGALLVTSSIAANPVEPKDTTKVVDIEEVIVVASPKENAKLRQQAASSSLFSQLEMQNHQITSLKNITSIVPNFYMPDYGSRLTSAIYIRGIGSRINTPAVGLYVDNIPYLDKSAFDFNFFDGWPYQSTYQKSVPLSGNRHQTECRQCKWFLRYIPDALSPHQRPVCLHCRRILQ